MVHSLKAPARRIPYRPRVDALEGRSAPGDTLLSLLGMTALGPGWQLLDVAPEAWADERVGACGACSFHVRWSVDESAGSDVTWSALADSRSKADSGRADDDWDDADWTRTTLDTELAEDLLASVPNADPMSSAIQPSANSDQDAAIPGAGSAATPPASAFNTPSGGSGAIGAHAGNSGNIGIGPSPIADVGAGAASPGLVARSTQGETGETDPIVASNGYLGDWVGPGEIPDPLQASGESILPPVLTNLAAPADISSSPDPGLTGPFTVLTQEYDFGNSVFQTTDVGLIELTAQVKAPANLPAGQLPIILLLHGRHNTTFQGTSAFLEWPPSGTRQPIPSYRGYEYLGDALASQGYFVVSISANGINARDNGVSDLGMLARAELTQRHLDILRDLNDTGVVTGVPGTPSPFGARFVGKLDLQNVGTMGHSRGGEGVVRHFILNQSLGSPYGIKAVFPLAPVDFQRNIINNVPLGVLLPYNDGDVSDLQGVHFYDDARYNIVDDLSPKHTFYVIGAPHNFYNTVWTPGLFPAGATDDGIGNAAQRMSAAQVRATGLAYMSAFFRAYIGVERRFLPILRGDVPPPESAQSTDEQIHVSYHAPDLSTMRRDVNRLTVSGDATVNILGGAVTQTGLTPYNMFVPPGSGTHALPAEYSSLQQPHTTPSARSSMPGLPQLRLGWNATTATWDNELPAGFRDTSGFYALQFRAGVNISDARNSVFANQDFTVSLIDGVGNVATSRVSDSSRALFYPPHFETLSIGSYVPKLFLNTIRIPLGSFAGIDRTDVRSVRFNFDQVATGALHIADVAFTDAGNVYAGPFVVSNTQRVVGSATSIRLRFNTSINVSTLTAGDVRILTPSSAGVTPTSVAVVPGTGNRQFDVSFPAQTALGTYRVIVGPDIRDLAGNAMDQDFDQIVGEIVQDRHIGQFVVVRQIDDGDAGFATTGYTLFSGQGLQNDVRYAAAGTGTQNATWTFTGLAAGQYRVAVTWTRDANRANNAPFSVFDNTTLRGTFSINQELAPNDFSDGGSRFEYLGTPTGVSAFTISSGTLIVRLTDSANDFTIADAVQIERVNDAPAARIVDDGDGGFQASAGFVAFAGQGFQNDVAFADPGAGAESAAWTFTDLTPGLYRVSATWSIHPNRATNAPFTVFDGHTALGTVRLNQELAPDDFPVSGANWKNLGGPFIISGSVLTVQLTDNANEYVIADAIRVERLASDPVRTLDDGDAGTTFSAGFFPFANQGFQADVRFAEAGTGTETANWSFTGLTAGVFKVSVTYSIHPNRATNAPFTVLNGAISLGTILVDQELAPNDFFAGGAGWRYLGNFAITGTTLNVSLSNLANEYVIADAVRIERLA
jgi:hypothetical protein